MGLLGLNRVKCEPVVPMDSSPVWSISNAFLILLLNSETSSETFLCQSLKRRLALRGYVSIIVLVRTLGIIVLFVSLFCCLSTISNLRGGDSGS
jgi:hypothetical protein